MTKEELITKQQLEIENLKELLINALDDKAKIRLLLTGIGGGLNDNVLGYDKEQQRQLLKILNLTESGLAIKI